MKKRSIIVTTAICAMLSGGIPAFADDANAQAQSGQTNANEQAGQQGQSAQQGREADHQIAQQIMELQQNPKQACDKLFLLNTAIGSMWEVQFSQLAADKAQNPQVKEAAQAIIKDHEQMNQQLQQAAQQLGIQVPQALPMMKQEELKVMAALPAQELEQAYISDMKAEHAKDISKFRSVEQTAQVNEVKQFAMQNLPKLQEHEQLIQQSATALGLGGQNGEAVPAAAQIQGNGANNGASNNATNGNK